MSDLKQVSNLRKKTGAGIVDCQKALAESNGDIEKAVEILRKKGALKAAKKSAERTASEGLVQAYVHANGKLGVLIEVNCETDFVARNEDFKELVHELAMQVAAMNPSYIKPEDIPSEELEKEKELLKEEMKDSGKPANVLDKIIEGKIEKYYEEVCLLKQPYIKDDKVKIEKLIEEAIAKIGEKIEVGRFVRYQM